LDFLTELTQRTNNINRIQSDKIDIDGLQPLIDLGYLDLAAAKPENPNRIEAITQAVKQFRKECEAENYLRKRYTFLPFEYNNYHIYAFSLNEIEQGFIQKTVSFDGDFSIQFIPKIGEISLTSRIIHYRLQLFGLFPADKINSPFSAFSLENLHWIKAFFEWQIDDLTLLNQIGNIEVLISAIHSELSNGKVSDKFIYLFKDGRFNLTVLQHPPAVVQKYYDFITRLFQMHLWANGLYHGEIDGKIMDNDDRYSTKSAIKELVKFINKTTDRNLKVRQLYDKTPLRENTYFLNVIDLLNETKAMQEETGAESVAEIVDDNRKLKKLLFDENEQLAEPVKEQVEERKTNFWSNNRRFYFGIKQVIKTIGSSIKRFFRRIGNFLKRAFNLFKRIAILIFQEIKEGIKVFFHGMKFLLGKRLITTEKDTEPNEIVSKYDLDFDSRLFVCNTCDNKTAKRHIEKCKNQMNALNISLIVTANVLRWALILATSGISWTQLLLIIAKKTKKIKLRLVANFGLQIANQTS
jgi:hypothetical protein